MSVLQDLLVVFGPKTALGREILSTRWASQRRWLLVARNEKDVEFLSEKYPQASILPAWRGEEVVPERYSSVVICCCAVGVIHPKPPDWIEDAEQVGRNIQTLAELLRAYAATPLHVIFVSSVLALMPRGKNTYYASWKSMVFVLLQQLVGRHCPKARLSALFPGRLLSARSLSRPVSYLHTTHRRLALVTSRLAESPKSRRIIIGVDARIWIAFRAGGLLLSALLGRP